MRSCILLAALLWSSGIFCSTPSNPKRTDSTSYATYSGIFTPPYSVAFLGIPYAELPVGDLRFRKPMPLITGKLNETVVIDASSYPDPCVQGNAGSGSVAGEGSEDCLKVNIYKPINATASSKLPVIFYIHGGGFTVGDPRNYTLDPWINQSPNIVAVTVYYRLSSLGFLTHPSFSNSSNGDNNAGYFDQVQALKWVKENIAVFGGDPDRITIDGESAGGTSVQMHLVSPESEGLFRGAIAQSLGRVTMPSPEQRESLFDFYANQAGCGSGNISTVFKCLRAAPVSVLSRAQDASSDFTGTRVANWKPVLDSKIFVDYPTNLLKDGKFARVPILAGSSTNESIPAVPCDTLRTCLGRAYTLLTQEDLDEFQRLYSKSWFPSEEALVKTAVGETGLRCGREILRNAGVKYESKAWTYRFNQSGPYDPPGDAEHVGELWFLFPNFGDFDMPPVPLNSSRTAFSQEMIAYWISFVRALDPNVHKLPRSPLWPGFEQGVRAVLQQDPNNSTTMSSVLLELEPSDEAERCQFIADKSTVMQI